VVVFWVLLPLFAWVIWEAFFRVLHILGALVLGVLGAPAVVAAVWAAACAVAAAILTFWVLRYGWRQLRAETRSAAQQGDEAVGP
jgi:divalent metal cation (Fe/Co/Zn/Cd) transporter